MFCHHCRRRYRMCAQGTLLAAVLALPVSAQEAAELPAPVVSRQDDASPPSRSDTSVTIPLTDGPDAGDVRISARGDRISLYVRDGSLKDVLSLLARTQNLNIVCGDDVDARITVTVNGVTLQNALDTILAVAGLTWTTHNDIIIVTARNQATRLSPSVQGRIVRVFELDYAAAEDVDQAIKAFLSPVGQSITSRSNPQDHLRTKEMVVVEDLPEYVRRIEEYVVQVDQAPRQVMIEAHVLQVDLKDDYRHGVDLGYLSQMVSPDLEINTTGFANAGAPQAFFVQLGAHHINGLIEALKATTDAKTLASPRVLAVNGQLSRIQIGEQLGFRVTTVTETSALEEVQFLDVGIVLQVTPRISRDGRILMRVKPEVSSGQINPETGLPEEETTELESDVLLGDGQGMVIGGLIKEQDSNVQSKIPWIGDLPHIGALFQRRQIVRSRSEVIIALVPHIVPFDSELAARNDFEYMRATTPLTCGPLHPHPRPFEAKLPDSVTNPTRLRGKRPSELHPHSPLLPQSLTVPQSDPRFHSGRMEAPSSQGVFMSISDQP